MVGNASKLEPEVTKHLDKIAQTFTLDLQIDKQSDMQYGAVRLLNK